MLHIRVLKTKGNSRSVQVYHYRDSKRVIIKHIGSGTTDEQIASLVEMARVFVVDYTKQTYLFEEFKPNEVSVFVIGHIKHIEISASISIRAFLIDCKKVLMLDS